MSSLKSRTIVIAILMIVVISIMGIALYSYQNGLKHEEVIKLTWHRTGGIAGFSELLVVDAGGSVSYSSNLFGNSTLILTKDEVVELMNKANFFATGREYAPKTNVADYFTYSLTLYSVSGSRSIGWVDEWASEETLPVELIQVQQSLDSLVQRARLQPSKDGLEAAIRTAKEFLIQAPTFRFDGINETLNVTNAVALESYPVQYVVTITFMSRHAGYGDRSGQFVAQVITPHEAVVKIVSNKVVSAILDGTWDEIKQELIQQNLPEQGTISGKVTIGPLCPVEPCTPKPEVYTSRELVLTHESSIIVTVKLNPDGTFNAKVNVGTYKVDLTDCSFLGCNRSLPQIVHVESNEVVTVEIDIDTGIR